MLPISLCCGQTLTVSSDELAGLAFYESDVDGAVPVNFRSIQRSGFLRIVTALLFIRPVAMD
ncbi:hypothetical protein SAMN05660733_02914 [Lentzea albidocapillata]|uniref:Uncharacterized protein n=1 Tax=Lentzea albidocapillata TaxID=40571 RepID=A0A1W2DDT9_9PSEU|nr:hypothetical protein SAMN05660733_02914 [Lentzea albidocapillata]